MSASNTVLGMGPRLVDVSLLWDGMRVRDLVTNESPVWIPATAEWAGPIEPPGEGA